MLHIKIKIGDLVPLFTLQDQNDQSFCLKDFIGKKKLIIYFYPKDESSACIKEACSFRDRYQFFEDAGALIIGINSASPENHRKFAMVNNLNFTLLSDPGNKVLKLFGIRNVLFLTGRETFVVDEAGLIKFRYRGFLNGSAHVEETIKYLKSESIND